MASFFSNQAQPNRYIRMYWGLEQYCSEPFATFLPRVVDLVTTVSGQGLSMWSQEEREIFHDQFHKALWDFEAPYMDRYFTREYMLTECTMDQLLQTAMRLDKNHLPTNRSPNGNFNPWRRWIQHTKADYERWWSNHEQEQIRGSRFSRNRRPARYNGGLSQLHHLADETTAEPAYSNTMEEPVVN